MKKWIMRLLGLRSKPKYVYGYCHRPEDNHSVAPVRMNLETGDLEFILWKASEQSRATDYWCRMGEGWEAYFVPNENQGEVQC